MLLNNHECMRELFALLQKTPVVKYEDNELNEAGNNALLLEEYVQQILSLNKYSITDILYSRYYWFTKFLVRYERLYGKDAGIKQQQFKIIEAMDYEGIVHWETLDKKEDLRDVCSFQDKGRFYKRSVLILR